MKQFRIEITGALPDTDPDLGAHAHVAAVPVVKELVKTLEAMGVVDVVKHIRTVRIKLPPATAKLAAVPKAPAAA